MALFLKYRPQTFADLVGQSSVRTTLQNALKAENPAHAYLFAGSRGTGKTSTARIFAKGLNCTDLQAGNPCGKCNFCRQTADGSLVDVIEIDAASNRGIDEIRDLRDKILFAPNIAKRKVYIIDEVHMLTKEAFNALLKTLEEPPDHAFFCLATTEVHKIPETIVSRCQTFLFQRFGAPQMLERLKFIADQEGFKYEEKALEAIVRKAEGGLRDGISILEQVAAETEQNLTFEATKASLGLSDSQVLSDFYSTLQSGNTEEALEIIQSITHKGQDLRTFGHDFLDFLRTQMHANLGLAELPFIMQSIEAFQKALTQIKSAPIVELPLEIAAIKLTQHITPVSPTPKAAPTPPIEPPTSSPAPTQEASPKPTPEPPRVEARDFVFETPTTPQPTPAKTETTPNPVIRSDETGNITAHLITQNLPTIVQKADLPIWAKKSLDTTTPHIEGDTIIFYTNSEFHREKLAAPEIKAKIQTALQEVCDTKKPIDFVKKANMVSNTPTAHSKPEESKASVDDFLSF